MSAKHRHVYKVLVVDRDHDNIKETVRVLHGADSLETAAETTALAIADAMADRHGAEMVFITVDEGYAEVLDTIARLKKLNPGRKVVALGSHLDAKVIMRAIRAGADEFLELPLQLDELEQVLDRFEKQVPAAQQEAGHEGRLIGVLGCRGGCGATTVACNLADILQGHHPTALVDFNAAQGDMSAFFDIEPSYTLRDISEMADRLDETLVKNITTKLPTGLAALFQPIEGRPSDLSQEEIRKLLDVLLDQYRFVVCDFGHDESIAKLISSSLDKLLIVMNQTIPSVYMTLRKLKSLEQAGIHKEHIAVVLNGYLKRSEVSIAHLKNALGFETIPAVRHDEANVNLAMNQGKTLHAVSKRGYAYKDLLALGNALIEAVSGDADPKKGQRTALRPLREKKPLFGPLESTFQES